MSISKIQKESAEPVERAGALRSTEEIILSTISPIELRLTKSHANTISMRWHAARQVAEAVALREAIRQICSQSAEFPELDAVGWRVQLHNKLSGGSSFKV